MLILLVLLLLLPAVSLSAQSTQTATWAITWTDTANKTQTGYNIERSATQTGTFTKIGNTNASTMTYNDVSTTDPGGTQRCYRVAAYNASGQGPYSTVACATSPTVTVPPPVNPPTNVNVSVTVTVTTSTPAVAPAAQKGK